MAGRATQHDAQKAPGGLAPSIRRYRASGGRSRKEPRISQTTSGRLNVAVRRASR